MAIKRIIATEKFKTSLNQIIYNNAQFFPRNFWESLSNKIENLKIFPRMYQKIEINEYRKIPIYNYIILYEVQKNIIFVVDIISTKSSYFNKIY